MAPEIVNDVISWFRGRRREKTINLGDTVVRGNPGFVPSDFSNRGTPSQVSPVVGGVYHKKKKENAGRMAPGIDSGSSVDARAAGQVLPGVAGVSPVKEEGVAGQMVPDISDKSSMGERSTDRALPGVAGVSPVNGKRATGQMVPDTRGESLAKEGAPGQISPKISGLSLKAKWDPSQVSPTVDGKKEEHMDSTHYVARNDGESSIVRRLHPDCNVIIPGDYHAAIEEIRTCPLDCPYKALEFAELDQKTLRNRPKPPK